MVGRVAQLDQLAIYRLGIGARERKQGWQHTEARPRAYQHQARNAVWGGEGELQGDGAAERMAHHYYAFERAALYIGQDGGTIGGDGGRLWRRLVGAHAMARHIERHRAAGRSAEPLDDLVPAAGAVAGAMDKEQGGLWHQL